MLRKIVGLVVLAPALAWAQGVATPPTPAPSSGSAAAPSTAVPPAGAVTAPVAIWANDHAKLVIQSVGPDGRLAGTYQNWGVNFSCSFIEYPVTGWLDGDRIGFTTLRQDHRNCTYMETWMGVIRGNELLVDFMALGARDGRPEILRGADSYRRQ